MSTQDPQFGVPNPPVQTEIVEADTEEFGVPALKRGLGFSSKLAVTWAGWFNKLRLWLYQPNSLAYQQSTATSIPNNAFTAILFDTNVWDVGGVHSTSTNTSRFTAPVTGLYLAVGAVQILSNTGQLALQVRKNGSGLVYQPQCFMNNNTAGNTANVSTLVQLAAQDYIEFYALQNSGGTLNTSTGTTWGSLTLQSQP